MNLHIQASGNITVITINRPQALNALNKEVLQELADFFNANRHNNAIRGIIVTGEGDKAFVAGADIK